MGEKKERDEGQKELEIRCSNYVLFAEATCLSDSHGVKARAGKHGLHGLFSDERVQVRESIPVSSPCRLIAGV